MPKSRLIMGNWPQQLSVVRGRSFSKEDEQMIGW
jgi:hypothetical protein